MRSALGRRAWRELTRRRARSTFTIVTIAAAVTAMWMFAIPQLTHRAMADRAIEHRLDDVVIHTGAIRLTPGHIEELQSIPNVVGLEPRAVVGLEVRLGDQLRPAVIVGVRDFADQEVNAVTVDSGALPGRGDVLVDPANRRSGRLDAGIGDELRVGGRSYAVSGEGGSLKFSEDARDGDPVVYMPQAALAQLTGSDRYYAVELRVADRARLTETMASVRAALEVMAPGLEYQTVPDVRPEGEWPGRETMENVTTLFYVLAALAAGSALFMVYTTMHAIVREQTDEIAVMKAIGGRRRQIAGTFARSALILGGLGTAVGVAAGYVLSNALLQAVATNFMSITPGWGLSWPVLALGVAVGLGGSVLASLPAVLRAVRVPVADAMRQRGIPGGYGQGRLDRVLQRVRLLPRISRIGLRNTARRKGASLATALQVGLAVGVGLGLLTLATTVMSAAEGFRAAEGGDIEVADGPGRPDSGDRIAAVEGVARVEGVYYSTIGVAEQRATMLGLPADTELFVRDLVEGRWFTAAEQADRERVAVVGRALAAITNVAVGDVVAVETPAGPTSLEIVGIDRNMVDDGKVVYLPIDTQYDLDLRTLPNWYWVRTASQDEAVVDRVAAAIGDELAAARYGYAIEISHVEDQAARTEERMILGIIGLLGVPVALIGMIGLASTMTVSVLDRTREIGILRSVGASARDVRRLIRAEALALAGVGWLLALPVGLGIGWAMLEVIGNAFHASFGFVVPYWAAPPALVATLVLAAVVVRRPARRAIGLSPGVALRYE